MSLITRTLQGRERDEGYEGSQMHVLTPNLEKTTRRIVSEKSASVYPFLDLEREVMDKNKRNKPYHVSWWVELSSGSNSHLLGTESKQDLPRPSTSFAACALLCCTPTIDRHDGVTALMNPSKATRSRSTHGRSCVLFFISYSHTKVMNDEVKVIPA